MIRDLSSLTVDPVELTPALAAGVYEYAGETTADTVTITATPSILGDDVEITVNDEPIENGGNAEMIIGENVVVINVGGADPAGTTYTITINKSSPTPPPVPPTDTAKLADFSVLRPTPSLSYEAIDLSPEFDADVNEYEASLAAPAATAVRVSATAEADGATLRYYCNGVEIEPTEIFGQVYYNAQLRSGENEITVEVDEDGKDTGVYTVTLSFEPTVWLNSISLEKDGEPLAYVPEFNPDVAFGYEGVANVGDEINFDVDAPDGAIVTCTYNGQDVTDAGRFAVSEFVNPFTHVTEGLVGLTVGVQMGEDYIGYTIAFAEPTE